MHLFSKIPHIFEGSQLNLLETGPFYFLSAPSMTLSSVPPALGYMRQIRLKIVLCHLKIWRLGHRGWCLKKMTPLASALKKKTKIQQKPYTRLQIKVVFRTFLQGTLYTVEEKFLISHRTRSEVTVAVKHSFPVFSVYWISLWNLHPKSVEV